jgi:hypothetical protein
MTDLETEMSLTEEMSLIVVITITTIRDILETLIEEMEILEGMTIDPLTFKDQSSSRPFNGNQQEGLNVNNEVATQHAQENKKVSNSGASIDEIPPKRIF